MPPSESLTEPIPPQPVSATEALPPIPSPPPSANGDDEAALARLADDGGPPAPQVPTPVTPPIAAIAAVPADNLLLEERIRRLENALVALQKQPGTEPPPMPPAAQSASTAVLLDVGKRLWGAVAPTAPSAPVAVPSIAHPGTRGNWLWLLWDTWAEARIIVRMFVDPRYHLPWSARVLPLVLLAAIVTSYYWIPGTSIPLLGWWINKAVDLLLAFLLFKWLGHEARRYRQTSPDLPPSLRL